MASIQTGIELNDQFTSVIYGIMDAVNMTVSVMEDMQQTMNADMDTSGIENVRDEIDQVTMAMNELNAAMQRQQVINTDSFAVQTTPGTVEAPIVPEQSRAPPAPVEIPVTWNTDGLDVFTGSGFERFQQEVQSVNAMLAQLSTTQDAIAQQAYNTNLLSPEALQSLNSLAVRMDRIRERIQQIENNPLNVGADTANAELEILRSQLNQAVQEQNDLNQAMQRMDVSSANDAYLRLSQTVGNTERYIRDNVDEQGRFNQEINEGISQADNLMNKIKGVVGAYLGIQAVGDVLNISDSMTQTTARLELIVDDGGSVEELQNKIFASAQSARGSYLATADAVSKLGIQAGNAFHSNDELIAFTELLNKQFVIAGTSAQGIDSVMLQLTQSMASGKLQGEELNAVWDNAATIVQDIQRYLEEVQGIDASNIKELASEGVLTADVIKSAMFYAADEINAQFEQMPMTWGQVWNSMRDSALEAFQPILQRINDIPNNEAFQSFVNGVIQALAILASIALEVFDFMALCGQFVANNWSVISPIVWGIVAAWVAYNTVLGFYNTVQAISNGLATISAARSAIKSGATIAEAAATTMATGAQVGLNAAMYACPIVWIIILIIALIAVIIMLCNWIAEATGAADSGIGIIVGALSVAVAFIGNIFVALINMVIDIFVVLWNFIAAFVNFFGNVFSDPVGAIARLFFDLVDCILGLLQTLAGAIDALFGSDLAGAVQGWRDDLGGWVDDTFGQGEEIMATVSGEEWHVDRFEYGEAWDAGVAVGDGISSAIDNFSFADIFGEAEIPNEQDYTQQFTGMTDSLDSISGDTSGISDAMDITQEDLKYMRDLAEQESVNRYTTAEINIEQTNHNTVKGGMDLDGIVSGLTDAVDEAVEIVVGKGE